MLDVPVVLFCMNPLQYYVKVLVGLICLGNFKGTDLCAGGIPADFYFRG